MTPGSSTAQALGCACDPIENHFGVGCNPLQQTLGQTAQYRVRGICPIHGQMTWRDPRPGPARGPAVGLRGLGS